MSRSSLSDRLDFIDYLTKVASIVKADHRLEKWRRIHVITGNEACDLDSAICALVYAYHLSKIGLDPAGDDLFLPILNIPREDYALKTEVKCALDQQGISGKVIVFIEDADWKSLHEHKKLQLSLVDHHVPVGAFAGMEDALVQIIDHHPVNQDDPSGRLDYLRTVPLTIEPVGSCSSLVGEKLLNSADFAVNSLTTSTAYLLYETIILDTSNFSKQAGKATEKDETIASQLQRLIPNCPTREEIFQRLKLAKSDVTGMSISQLLRKDQKLLDVGHCRILVSSVPLLASECISSGKHLEDMKEICRNQKVDGTVILASRLNVKNGIEKELFVYAKQADLMESICDGLCTSQSVDLGLQPYSLTLTPTHEANHCWRAFKQDNVIASRKQILPLLRDILVCRKNSGCNHEIPSTATPPNTYIEQGFLGSAETFSEKLHKRVAESNRNPPEPKNESQFDYDSKGRFEPLTPSNTYIEESGAMMKTPQKDQVVNLLRSKMAALELDQESTSTTPLDCSRRHSNDFHYDENNEHEKEIFDMD